MIIISSNSSHTSSSSRSCRSGGNNYTFTTPKELYKVKQFKVKCLGQEHKDINNARVMDCSLASCGGSASRYTRRLMFPSKISPSLNIPDLHPKVTYCYSEGSAVSSLLNFNHPANVPSRQ